MDIWHKRLGHGLSHMLSKVFRVNSEVVSRVLNKCSVCPCAKQTRSAFPVSSIKSNQCFDWVNLDV